jgi:zinc protease
VELREREVAALERESLEAFHRASYGPASMVVAVVGQVEPDEVAAGFEGALEGWSVPEAAAKTWPEAEEHEASEAKIRIADRPNLDVFLGHRGRLLRGDEDYGAAVLANSCLGQSTLTSRLGLAVRDRAGLTYGIYSRFFGTLGIAGPWATYLTVAPEGLERAVELCRLVITEYLEEGPGEEELADERTALAGAYRVGLATNAGVARELVTVMTAGQPVERLDRYPEQLLAVSRDEVMAAIQRHFDPQRLVLTAAGTID